MTFPAPAAVRISWRYQYRIVASRFPPIDVFESVADPDELAAVWAIESLTNDRLRAEAGELYRVGPADWITGPGSSPLMAAFTHIGTPARFNDATFGVYYAANRIKTAVRETCFHREQFLRYTREPPMTLDQRVYRGRVAKPLLDVRDQSHYAALHDPDDYATSQRFATPLRTKRHWGLVYRSVRDPGGQCIAAFRPPAVTRPIQHKHLAYDWDGEHITDVYEKRALP